MSWPVKWASFTNFVFAFIYPSCWHEYVFQSDLSIYSLVLSIFTLKFIFVLLVDSKEKHTTSIHATIHHTICSTDRLEDRRHSLSLHVNTSSCFYLLHSAGCD